jgi:FtsZ-interacting cell division protein ZipA
MATEVRNTSTNNNAVWIVVGVIALLAILIIAWMAMANGNRNNVVADTVPAPTVSDVGSAARNATDAAADSAASAARSAQQAANNAAASANDAARDAAATVGDTPGFRATIPAGDANVTVQAPAR